MVMALKMLKDTGIHWLLVGGGGEVRQVKALFEKVTTAPRSTRLVLSKGCTGPWAILNSEWARTLLLRLSDSLLTRKNRIGIKKDIWGHEIPAEEDSGVFSDAMCMVLR